MRPPLRLLGQPVEPGRQYEVELLAAGPCNAVPELALGPALTAAGFVGTAIRTEPAAGAGCRVFVRGTSPLGGDVRPLSLVRVPGMAVVAVRDVATGRTVFPEDSGAPTSGRPASRPGAEAPPRTSAAPSGGSGVKVAVGVALAATVVAVVVFA